MQTEAEPSVSRRPRRGVVDIAAVLFATASVGVTLSTILRANRLWLVRYIPDDAFYYLEVGQRIGRGEGSTFDGIHRTNGFHPVWQLVVGGLGTFLHGDALVRASLIVGVVFSVVALALFARLLSQVIGRTAALVAVAIAIHSAQVWYRLINGMETSAELLALALLTTAVVAALRQPSTRRVVVAGLASGLLVLTRLDYLVLIPLVGILLAVRVNRRAGLTWVGGLVPVVAPYFLWNLLTFGMFLSVSGSIKLHWMLADARTRYGGIVTAGYLKVMAKAAAIYVYAALRGVGQTSLTQSGALTAVTVLGTIVLIVLGARRNRQLFTLSPVVLGLALAVALVIAKAGLDVVTLPRYALTWYAGTTLALVVLVLAGLAWLGVENLTNVPRAVGLAVLVLLAFPAGPFLHVSPTVDPSIWWDSIYLATNHLRAHPAPGRIGAFDAGQLGFYLDPVPVVNLDGLVNDGAYAKAVIADDSQEALERKAGVKVVVNRFPRGAPQDEHLPSCATVLWKSPKLILYSNFIDHTAPAPLIIATLENCH